MYKLREYQSSAVHAGVSFFQNTRSKKNGVLVLPTGSGKSLVIASIAQSLAGDTLVLQPNKEILEQNFQKTLDFGFSPFEVGIFSASAGEKNIRKITFATIGSIMNRVEEFKHFSNIIIDECHTVNSEAGQYQEYLESMGCKVLGLSATPFRLHSKRYQNGYTIVEAKFLHRTRPRIFSELLHVTQVSELYRDGFLCPLKYDIQKGYDQEKLVMNTTGMDWLDESIREYNSKIGLVGHVEEAIKKHNAKHTLVFCKFVEEADILRADLENAGMSAAIVTGATPAKEREQILSDFKNGKIKVVTNVGVLTTGFDFPALDCVILARPTQSVALYYQILGRGLRTHSTKDFCTIVDLCGNVERFGKIESFEIVGEKGVERLKSDAHFLTGWNFFTNKDAEDERKKVWGDDAIADEKSAKDFEKDHILIMPYGKYKGAKITAIPLHYRKYMVEKGFVKGAVLDAFKASFK